MNGIRRGRTFAALTAAAALSLSACGGDTPSVDDAASAASDATDSASKAAGEATDSASEAADEATGGETSGEGESAAGETSGEGESAAGETSGEGESAAGETSEDGETSGDGDGSGDGSGDSESSGGSGDGSDLLKAGSSGDEVRAIQEQLGITATGTYDPETVTAVKQFQSENDLKVDGIVGPETRAALNG